MAYNRLSVHLDIYKDLDVLFLCIYYYKLSNSAEHIVPRYSECSHDLSRQFSIEEAKLKMYACSTTTYTGFQAVMTEEESEKFNGIV